MPTGSNTWTYRQLKSLESMPQRRLGGRTTHLDPFSSNENELDEHQIREQDGATTSGEALETPNVAQHATLRNSQHRETLCLDSSDQPIINQRRDHDRTSTSGEAPEAPVAPNPENQQRETLCFNNLPQQSEIGREHTDRVTLTCLTVPGGRRLTYTYTQPQRLHNRTPVDPDSNVGDSLKRNLTIGLQLKSMNSPATGQKDDWHDSTDPSPEDSLRRLDIVQRLSGPDLECVFWWAIGPGTLHLRHRLVSDPTTDD